jgi:hypothetical protein
LDGLYPNLEEVQGLRSESILANHKKALGIQFESGRRLGAELAFSHGIDLGRGRGIGI